MTNATAQTASGGCEPAETVHGIRLCARTSLCARLSGGGCEPTEAVHGIRLSGLQFDRLCGGS